MNVTRVGLALSGVLLLMAVIAIATGLKQLQVWSQIYWIWCHWFPVSGLCEAIVSDGRLLKGDQVGSLTVLLHTIRLVPLLPIMGVGVLYPQSLNLCFSLGCLLLLFLMSRLMASIAVTSGIHRQAPQNDHCAHRELLAAAALFALCSTAYFMNGRLVSALLAEVLLLYLYARKPDLRGLTTGQRLLMVFALICSFVSSMTVIVCGVSALLWWLKLNLRLQNEKSAYVSGGGAVLTVMLLVLPLLKLYQQYGYSLLNLMQVITHHGSGRYFLSDGFIPFLLAVSIVFGLWVRVAHGFLKRDALNEDVLEFGRLIFWTCMLGGFFGYAAYALAVVPVIQLMLSKGHNLLRQRLLKAAT